VKFAPTPLAGAYVVDLERLEDDRGFFARSFCVEEFAKLGLDPAVAQCSVSFNRKRGTLRGLHYQSEPFAEAKLIRCTQGAIFDVVVDLRPGSLTFGRWVSVELSAENHRMLYAPEGFAHGLQTLSHHAEVFYQMSQPYRPELARGVRYDDPQLAIEWPLKNPILSERDRALPRLTEAGAAA
jgi:dTDP-4-dehydrorhamnose 3,5-epimerase